MGKLFDVNTLDKETTLQDFIKPGSRVELRFSDDESGTKETFLITNHPSKDDTETPYTKLLITSPLGIEIQNRRAGETLTFKSERSGEVVIEIISVDNS